MVALDHQLLFAASRFCNGANVHNLGELIFAYKVAGDLHNQGRPGHEIYRIQSEVRLRNYVIACQDEIIRAGYLALKRGRPSRL